jgi:hypothetical protein
VAESVRTAFDAQPRPTAIVRLSPEVDVEARADLVGVIGAEDVLVLAGLRVAGTDIVAIG